MAKRIQVGGRIESKEVGGIVTGAAEILDDAKGKKQSVINGETDDELSRLDQSKQDNLTFDNAPTEGSDNPVKSGGLYTAQHAILLAIAAINELIPSAASALNQLADKAFVNSSISTNTATFRGTSAAGLNEQQFLAWANGLEHDLNDYVFWQTSDAAGNTLFKRYKWNGTEWAYEYTLNNSTFTAEQWEAIQSGITALLVAKLRALPTAQELIQSFDSKQDVLTFDDVPTLGSTNPVKSSGIYNVIKAITDLVPAEATAQNQLADKADVAAKIVAAIPSWKGQYDALTDLQAVTGAKAGDMGCVKTTDSDGHAVLTFYQYSAQGAWVVYYTLRHYAQNKPATTGTTGDHPYNGMGKIVLQKNIVNGVNTLTQTMLTQQNTIYVIQYDFVLGEDITVPGDCVLEFDGGSISGDGTDKDTITGSSTKLNANDYDNILNSVILDGTFDVNYLTVEHFGVKPGSGNATTNTTIINTYVIPSMQNIGIKLIVPSSTDTYRISDTISMDGSFDFICDGEIFYEGVTENIAVEIIPTGFRPTNKEYRIKLSANNVTYSDSDVPERIGVYIKNLNNCNLYLDKIIGFTYPAILEGNNTGFTSNKVYLKAFNNYFHVGLTLKGIGTGWINENTFYGGNFTKLSDDGNNSTAISIIGNVSGDHAANNNIFYNPSFEGCANGVSLTFAKNNIVFHPRLERVTKSLVVTDNESADNIIIGNYRLPSKSNMNNICIDDFDFIKLKGSVIFDGTIKIFNNGTTHGSNVYQLQSTDAGQGIVVESTNPIGYYGVILDISVYKKFLISTDVDSRRAIFFLDSNNQILATPNTIDYYIINNKTWMIPSKNTHLFDGGARKEAQVEFTSNVTKAMICLVGTADISRLSIRSIDGGSVNDILLNPIPLKFFTTKPTSVTRVDAGEQIFLNSKPLWWNGTAWVDATGTPV